MKSGFKGIHIYRRTISLLLTLVLLFLAIPQIIFAEIRDAAKDELELSASLIENADSHAPGYTYNVTGDVYELEDRREAAVKHFRTEDGSVVAAQYPTDVHIIDSDGKWADIDNTLTDQGNEYGTGNTGIKFAKKITGNESLFTIHSGNGKLTMSLDGAIKKTEGRIIGGTSDGDETKLGKLMNLEKLYSGIMYENILDGVDLEYVAEGRNVKENIIINEKADTYSFTFTLKLNNLDAELLSDGSVIIYNEANETVFAIPAPVTYDAQGSYAPAEATYFSLAKTGNNIYKLTVTADSAWMNSNERVYPITVDPTLNATQSSVVDTSIRTDNKATTYAADNSLYVWNASTTSYAYWKTTSLPIIPNSALITDATISLYAYSVSGEARIGVYNVTSNWDSTLTWNKYNAGSNGKTSTSMEDYVLIPAGGTGSRYTWDITDMVEKWYLNTPNYGLCFKNETSGNVSVTFSSMDHSNASQRPVFTITYRDVKGLESYYSYVSQDAGLAGQSYINIATGKMTLTNGTLTTTDSLFGFTPTLVYNSVFAGKSYCRGEAEVPYSAADTKTPYAFKWNFQETIVKKTYTDSEGTSINYYILADSDGTEHAFYDSGITENGSKVYHDENGLQLKMYIGATEITIKDLDKTIRHYTQTNFSGYGTAWYLTSIVDVSGNKLDFTWKTGTYLPLSVRVTPNGGSTITMLEFLYTTDGILYAVHNPTSKEAVILRCSETADGSTSPSAWQYLRKIEWVKYDSVSNLSSYHNNVISTTGITRLGSASYVYYAPYKTIFSAIDDYTCKKINYVPNSSQTSITTLMEYGSTGELGQSVYLTYLVTSYGYTKVVTSGSDDVIDTNDDIITYYNVDFYGRVVSTYTTDSTSQKLYGATYGEYETQENAKNNIKHTFSVEGSTVNLLANGNFSKRTNNEYPHWTVSGNAYITSDGPQFYSTSSPGVGTVTQAATLPAATFTLSTKVNTYGTSGATVILKARSQDSVYNFEKAIPVDENNVSVGDNVFSLTFTTTASKAFEISVSVSYGGSTDYKSVTVKEIVLEKGIGVSEKTLVQLGGFETVTNGTTVGEYWKTESGAALTPYSYSKPFREVASITADITKEKYVKQTVSEYYYDAYDLGEYRYFISGFGKATQSMSNDTARFALRVDVYYYVNAGNSPDELETHRFDFNENDKDWQFVSGTFTTKAGRSIHKIEVICEYAYQPNGTAYFDNISFRTLNKTFTEYDYYPSGLVYREQSGYNTHIYEYNSDGTPKRVANNRGELTDYEYDASGKHVIREIEYTFVNTNSSRLYPIPERDANGEFMHEGFNADSKITKTPKYATDYIYNTYGLLILETSYPAEASGTAVAQKSGSKKITSSYEYKTSAGSHIFGALLTETDSAGRQFRYYYNEQNGYLLASINVTDGNGTAYTYDYRGRLISVTPAVYTSSTDYSAVTGAQKVSYDYDALQRLCTITTDSTTYNFSYDTFGNSTEIAVGESTLASYEYHPNNGKLSKLNYSNGTTVEYKYGDLDNISEIWYTEDGGTPTLAYSYTYTAKGQLHSLEDHENGLITVYEYNENGKLFKALEYDSETYVNRYEAVVYYKADTGLVATANYHIAYPYSGASADAKWDYSYLYNQDQTLDYVDVYNPTADGRISYTYDDYYRLSSKVYAFDLDTDSSKKFTNTTTYEYKNYSGGNTGIEVDEYSTKVNDGTALSFYYTYDARGNITEILTSNFDQTRYVYDDLGQLIREDNNVLGRTYVYTYDDAGNITSKNTYALTAEGATPSTLYDAYGYYYSDSNWGDMLTAYRGMPITYDEVGNPLSYYNGTFYDFTWVQGRRLESVLKGGATTSYTYNADGIRTSKTTGTLTKEYILNGTQVLAEIWSDGTTIIYVYDAEGSPFGMLYRESTYTKDKFDVFWFERNLHGDVIAVYDNAGTKLITYTYDAWGKVTTTYHNGGANTGAANNPFKYRGYYHDSETNFYYLNSRYYDPAICRFINADAIIAGNAGDLQGYNLFAYCFNNPVNLTDGEGNWPRWIKNVCAFVENIAVAIVESIEVQIGIGFGLGVDVSDNITAEVSRDTYVGIDDGELIAGNVITAEASLFEVLKLGNTYNHLSEKGGNRVTSSGNAYDGPFDMIGYSDVTHGNQLALGPFVINDEGDFLISVSASVHIGYGGSASAAFNVIEFFVRLFD